ncbi:MAG: hypothetical protein G01um1014106_274 [Parcubacteria group bacterium Gr01-1014_106]|nr:MAG: hypothetical protein G01um1014106_274 [Parcubacteria group bacterium Gr01-1014_106]
MRLFRRGPTKLFVWDFHGVLERGTEHAVFEITNAVLARCGYGERLAVEDNEHLYGRKWYEYFAHALPHEPPEKHLMLQRLAFEFSDAHPRVVGRHLSATEYAEEVLAKVAARHEQILLSNSRPGALRQFLQSVGLLHFFNDGTLHGLDGHRPDQARSKPDALAEYIRNKSFKDVIVIGDSLKDIELALAYNGVSYLYRHPGRSHPPSSATYKISDLREVLREV